MTSEIFSMFQPEKRPSTLLSTKQVPHPAWTNRVIVRVMKVTYMAMKVVSLSVDEMSLYIRRPQSRRELRKPTAKSQSRSQLCSVHRTMQLKAVVDVSPEFLVSI